MNYLVIAAGCNGVKAMVYSFAAGVRRGVVGFESSLDSVCSSAGG